MSPRFRFLREITAQRTINERLLCYVSLFNLIPVHLLIIPFLLLRVNYVGKPFILDCNLKYCCIWYCDLKVSQEAPITIRRYCLTHKYDKSTSQTIVISGQYPNHLHKRYHTTCKHKCCMCYVIYVIVCISNNRKHYHGLICH